MLAYPAAPAGTSATTATDNPATPMAADPVIPPGTPFAAAVMSAPRKNNTAPATGSPDKRKTTEVTVVIGSGVPSGRGIRSNFDDTPGDEIQHVLSRLREL